MIAKTIDSEIILFEVNTYIMHHSYNLLPWNRKTKRKKKKEFIFRKVPHVTMFNGRPNISCMMTLKTRWLKPECTNW